MYRGPETELGYHIKHIYHLEVRQHLFHRISVRPTHGYTYKPLEGMRCCYRNLHAFLQDWRPLESLGNLGGI